MKNLKRSLVFIACCLWGVAVAGTPIATIIPVDHIYSPKGFDSNDNTEIIISGHLPNLCHKAPQTKVEVKGRQIEVTMEAYRYDASNPFCPEVIIPFVESVSVGVLDKGIYNITVNGKSVFEKKASIGISESTSDAIDDYAYANVEYVEKSLGSDVVKLRGYNPSDCFQFEEIIVVSNNKDTYSVLPKMKKISDFCPMKMVPFSYEMVVPDTIKAEKVLLHVREIGRASCRERV